MCKCGEASLPSALQTPLHKQDLSTTVYKVPLRGSHSHWQGLLPVHTHMDTQWPWVPVHVSGACMAQPFQAGTMWMAPTLNQASDRKVSAEVLHELCMLLWYLACGMMTGPDVCYQRW